MENKNLKGVSATKAGKINLIKYGLPEDFLSNGQKTVGGGPDSKHPLPPVRIGLKRISFRLCCGLLQYVLFSFRTLKIEETIVAVLSTIGAVLGLSLRVLGEDYKNLIVIIEFDYFLHCIFLSKKYI